jgi:hypothetical protein
MRPEHVAFTADAVDTRVANADLQSLPGKVADDVFIGERRLLHIETAVGLIVAGNRVNSGAGRLATGTAGTVQWETNDMMVFPM